MEMMATTMMMYLNSYGTASSQAISSGSLRIGRENDHKDLTDNQSVINTADQGPGSVAIGVALEGAGHLHANVVGLRLSGDGELGA